MKRILFVIHSLEYGGAERSLVNLLHELPEDRYEVDVLLFQKKGDFLLQLPPWVRVLDGPAGLQGLYAPLRRAGRYLPVKLIGTGCARLARKTRKSRAAWRWRNFYRRQIAMLPGEYDTAVAYVGGEILYFIADRVRAGRRLVWIHNDYRTAGYSKADDQPYFARMDGIVSVSRECVSVLQEEFPEYEGKIHCIENITSSRAIRMQAGAFVPKEYRKDGFRLLSVGRLSPQKGFDMAIDAAAILKEQGLDFCWYVLGAGTLEEELRRKIREKELEAHFVLLGTRANPYPYIANCTLFVQPSRYEGKSVVLDEAKILCAPIVATAYPTVRDQILDGREGVIAPMHPEGIAETIGRLLEDAALRGQIRDYLAAHEYGNQAEVEKYRKLLDDESYEK